MAVFCFIARQRANSKEPLPSTKRNLDGKVASTRLHLLRRSLVLRRKGHLVAGVYGACGSMGRAKGVCRWEREGSGAIRNISGRFILQLRVPQKAVFRYALAFHLHFESVEVR
jgi:hypothetical protein